MRASSWSSGGSASACSSCFSSRLRLELGLDRYLLGQRDQQAAPLDQPPRDVLVAALDHLTSLALAELPLPVEDAGLRALGLGLGDPACRLVEAREGRVRERVVGRQLAEPLPRPRSPRRGGQLAERHAEAVPRVGELRIDRQRLAVDRDRLLGLPVAEEIGRPVVELVLGRHASMRSPYRRHRQVAR
jgi:hypothetical protein